MTREEKILKETIKQIVRESIFDYINGGMHEKSDNSDNKEKDSEKRKISNKRKKRIIEYLKDEKTDIAPYAYELWPDKEEDSARSYFYKCLNGKTNDNGDVYSFSDEELNRLHSMITNRKMKIK